MKILDVSEHTCHYITTDEEYWPEFRRNGPNNWEQRMGESWEVAYMDEDKLESLYQDYIRRHTL